MTARGKIVLTIIVLAVVGFGMYRWWDKIAPQSKSQNVSVDVAKVKEEIAKAKAVPVDIPLLAGTNVATLIGPGKPIVALVKPQFEAGKGKVGKGGVVRDEEQIQGILEDMRTFVEDQSLAFCGIRESVLKGPKGNREFFLYARKS